MRKTLLLAMVLLASAAWAAAQQAPTAPRAQNPSAQAPNAQPPDTEAPPPAAGDTIEGCLGGGAGNFTLTDKAGTTYQLQLPPGTDTDNLSKHVGEEVRVSGTMANSAAGNQGSIHVTRMNKIADSCSAGSTANPSK
jgi:hypothetical protein